MRQMARAVIMMFGSVAILAAAVASQGPGPLKRYTYTEYHMGVDTRLVVYAPDKSVAESACADAFERIATLDSIMSDYRKNSELTHLSDQAGGQPIGISAELMRVFQVSQEFSRHSDGMFDVTIGPVVQLWRKARKTKILPTLGEIDAARRLVDYRGLILDTQARTAYLKRPGMRLDLGAIGKGYADDEALAVLKHHGIKSALIEMGGDVVVSNPPPGMKGWKVEVPNAGNRTMTLSNCAISSSGDTEQFVEIGGKHFSHVVNPKTGWALTQRVQVTVIAPTGLIADPLSTSFTLVAPTSRDALLKQFKGVKAFVKRIDNGQPKG